MSVRKAEGRRAPAASARSSKQVPPRQANLRLYGRLAKVRVITRSIDGRKKLSGSGAVGAGHDAGYADAPGAAASSVTPKRDTRIVLDLNAG